MKTYLSILAILYSYFCTAQSWQAVGPDDFKQISYAGAFNSKVYLDTLGNAYISYIQGAIGTTSNTFTIKKETPAGWVQTTQVTATGLYSSLQLDKAGNFYLADDTLVAGSYALRLRKFDGTSWSLAAPLYPVNSNTHPYLLMRLDKMDNPAIVYSDTGISVFPKMVKWGGTNWNPVGGVIVNTLFKAFIFDFNSANEPFVRHFDALSNTNQIKKYDGTNWITTNTNVVGESDFRIYKDTMYSSGGGHGWWGGLLPWAPYSSLYKFNGTSWAYIGGINTSNTEFFPLIASLLIRFDDNGNTYLAGGTIWKIQNGVTSKFGAAGDLAVKNDTFYTVTNSEYHRDKLRVVKNIANTWIEEYPVSIAPFLGGGIGQYSFPNSTNYTAVPYHKLFKDAKDNIWISSPTIRALSKYNSTTATWDTLLFQSSSIDFYPPYTMLTDTASNIYLLQRTGSSALSLVKRVGNNWSFAGGPVDNNSPSSYGSVVFDKNNVPHVAYVDLTTFGAQRVRVKKYNGASWIDVSTVMPFVSSGPTVNPLIVCDTANHISVLYREGTNLYMKKFDGTNWNAIGGLIDTSSNSDYKVALTTAGEPVVLNLKSFSGKLKPEVKRYDGTNWNTVGLPGFTPNPVADPSLLVAEDTIYAAYTDKTLKTVVVAKFNGTHWGALGSMTIARDSSSYPNLIESGNDIYLSYHSNGLFLKKNATDTIVPLFTCTPPALAINNVLDTSATASWTNSLPVLGYEYNLSTTNTPPSGNGIFTNLLTYPANGLQPNTTYYFFIRTICGIDTSAWVMQSFVTSNATGIRDMHATAGLKLYPNPVTSVLTIEQINTASEKELELYDMYGRNLRSIRFTTKSIQLDLRELPAGIYLLKDKNRKGYPLKIVKQ